jgi:hypothetical protein
MIRCSYDSVDQINISVQAGREIDPRCGFGNKFHPAVQHRPQKPMVGDVVNRMQNIILIIYKPSGLC